MTRVRKVTAVTLMTPLAAGALALGVNVPAHAADTCWPLAHATITDPGDSITTGSTAHLAAQVSGMLLGSHLQIAGPGFATPQQVGPSKSSGDITGDVVVKKAGYYTLSVVGNGTKCTYESTGFPVKQKPAPKPTHSSAPAKPLQPGKAGGSVPKIPGSLPGGGQIPGGKTPGGLGGVPLNGSSPFSLPSVAPDGTGPDFQNPTPDPQVAAPAGTKPLAHDTSAPTPISWEQSVAVAMVLLLLSAHMGMWSRRQRRLATAGGPGRSGAGKAPAKGKKAATKPSAAKDTKDTKDTKATVTSTLAETPASQASAPAAGGNVVPPFGTGTAEMSAPRDAASGTSRAAAPDTARLAGDVGDKTDQPRVGYRGRRRRS